MSKFAAMRRAVELYNNPLVEKRVNRHNQRAWLRSISILGDNWLLSTPVQKKET